MRKTKKSIIKEYTNLNFDSEENFEKFVRKNNKAPDYVAIRGILYTMDGYDFDGRFIYYYNKRTDLGFYITTKDRYNEGFNDAKVSEIHFLGTYRTDVEYAD